MRILEEIRIYGQNTHKQTSDHEHINKLICWYSKNICQAKADEPQNNRVAESAYILRAYISPCRNCSICEYDCEGILDLSIPKLEKKVNIIISNGSGSKENIPVGSSITIKADKPKEGMKFVGWADKDGNIVSTDETYTFVVTEDTYLIAIYEEIEGQESSGSSSSSEPLTSNSSQLSSSSKENNSSNDQDKIDAPYNKIDVIIVTSIITGTVSISLIITCIYLFLKKKK